MFLLKAVHHYKYNIILLVKGEIYDIFTPVLIKQDKWMFFIGQEDFRGTNRLVLRCTGIYFQT